jgi:homoserine O-acetyltransferase
MRCASTGASWCTPRSRRSRVAGLGTLRALLGAICAVFLVAGAGCATDAVTPKAAAAAAAPSLENVAARTLTLRDFRLQSGVVLKEVTIAYETYGRLDASGRNAVLITHGNTSDHHAAGYYMQGQAALGVRQAQLGWWDELIGPGKAFDTDRRFVVSSNMLGGAFGTTGPRSPNPATGRPYGPDFPDITLGDMVAAQKALLDALGVKHLAAVAGPSYGGFLAFQWGIDHPQMVDGLVVVVSSPTGRANPRAVAGLVDALAKDPNWNGGWYYDRGGVNTAMTDLRVATLKSYGLDRELAGQYPNPAARDAEIRRRAQPWAEVFDANSLVVQRKAMEFRDHARDFARIRAKVLYVLCTSDRLFPTSLAPGVMHALQAAGVDATYFELASIKGHRAGTQDAITFEPALRTFLQRLEPGPPQPAR